MTQFNEALFWSKVDKRGPDDCWEWTGAISTSGYGHIGLDGKARRGHRVAWQLTNGGIPDGLCCCHHCDNRKCCNPNHLFLGTVADNNRDCEEKGRGNHPRGENHGRAKLTVMDVQFIRHWLKIGKLFLKIHLKQNFFILLTN